MDRRGEGQVLALMSVPESDQIRFLLNVQRLLTEGQFTATYKFALLMALADLSIERGDNGGEPLDLPAESIAEKFIEYYWRQAVPFLGQGVLSQNKGRQPVVITLLARARDRHGDNLASAKRDSRAWRTLVVAVTRNIRQMPLRYLQNVGGGSLPFFYDQPKGTMAPATIRLRAGVAFCFRQFHELIAELVRGAWVRWVHQQNLSLIGEKQDLHAFLFGTARSNLGTVRVTLQGIQTSCFYCRRSFGALPVVDHFIPWVLYPLDLGHNFVLAHGECNSQKRDLLPAEEHLAAWTDRNRRLGEELQIAFDQKGVLHNLLSTVSIATWAYSRAAANGGLTWRARNEVMTLGGRWSSLLAR